MSTMADNVIADNRPPMLNKSRYNSWQSRMLLYIKGKEHGKQLYDSVINGPFKYRTVEVPRTPTTPASMRDITYDDLTEAKNIREACDIRTTNITDAGDVARDNATRTRVILNTRMLLQTSHRLFDATTAEVKVILVDSGLAAQALTTNVIFQTYGIDAFDFDVDEAPIESAAFITKLSDYGFDVLFNTMFEQNVQEMQYSEQPVIDDDSTIENISDNNVISFDQYLKETENEVVQSTTSPYQQNAVIIHKTLSKENKEKQEKYIEEIIDLEKEKKALENIVYKQGQSMQTMHMLTKPQVFYNESHKTALGYQSPLYLTQAQRKVHALYYGHTIVKKHDALFMIDIEETLILAEESRIKMLEKQNDLIMKEKKVDITPIDYVALNKLFEKFVNRFVPKKQLSAEQAFWLPISKIVSKNPLVQPEAVQKEIPRELPSISLAKEITDMKEVFNQMDTEVKEYVMCTTMHADIKHNCVLPANDNNLAYAKLEKSYIAKYSKVLELEAELIEKKDMIEQDVFIELSKSYSKLEKQCISLEIALQQSKDKFQNDKPCENHDAPEFYEFFEINELKAQLQAKNTKSAS
ncbi:hypothetical protein Tco_1092562 [Tanacetum coccineum]|uniref:Uncharacterized protein n=1 Tax=Tanacetum coccineum TaxID=301880 RepID=A0ABQ5IA81_9ASTR